MRIVPRCFVLFFSLAGLEAGWAATPKPPSNSDCLECHSDKTLAKTNEAKQVTSLFVDQARYANSVHRTNACVSCHADVTAKHPDDNLTPKQVDCAKCHAAQSESYKGSVHAVALLYGKSGAPACVDCHSKHDIVSHYLPDSPLHFTKLTKTCGECHPEVANEVKQSVHGKSVAQGHRDAATCIDCHSEHKIEDLRKASPIKISEQVCSKCHASERIRSKYRLPPDRVKTFMESYHGLASQYGSTRAANCASCHGVHLILASSDARSMIHTNNLVKTCGKCHPGATENFAVAKIHTNGEPGKELGSQVNFWVRRLYLVLIFGTIGGMLAHNLLSWRRKIMASLHASRTVVRMDLSQRMQHLLLATSFIVLGVTGFALKFPDSWLARLLGSDETFRRMSHRVAGVVMLVLGAYHLLYVVRSPQGRQLLKDFLPCKKDLDDFKTNTVHLLSRGQPRAKFARFGYPEKAEYWAVVWGTVIMGVTGFMLWFPVSVTQFLPRWAVDVATTIHYYEAILACLAIVVWHFYHVMFDPEVYPLNWACWDGRVSEEWYRHEHPLDTKATAFGEQKKDGGKPVKPDSSA
ncbi:MAG: cytochrome b/b6 domain-containing protein [Verrucomicrobia bacterium]|nr:cytochrome b/b6 domain-containing protein [Verrucomicrobiota bacterium]